MRHFSPAILFVLAAGACTSRPGGDAERVASALSLPPEVGFASRPAYLPTNAIALTFDDGADGTNTPRALDVLRDKGVKATFFINSINFGDLNQRADLKEIVRRIVAEGHGLANHTVHHSDLTTLTPEAIDAEITGVQETIRLPDIFGSEAPRLTLIRAPYGRPYQTTEPGVPHPGRDLVAPIVARHGVHVGWNISVRDTSICRDAECVLTQFKNATRTVGTGAYGVVLLHSVQPWTVEALPALIDHCRENGFVFMTAEEVVQARFGMSSAEVVDRYNSQPPPDAGPPDTTPDATPDAGPPDTTPDVAPPEECNHGAHR